MIRERLPISEKAARENPFLRFIRRHYTLVDQVGTSGWKKYLVLKYTGSSARR
jgi:hypothetical protein